MLLKMLQKMEAIAVQTRREADRQSVRLHAEMINNSAQKSLHENHDQERIQAAFERVKQILDLQLDKDEATEEEKLAAEEQTI